MTIIRAGTNTLFLNCNTIRFWYCIKNTVLQYFNILDINEVFQSLMDIRGSIVHLITVFAKTKGKNGPKMDFDVILCVW